MKILLLLGERERYLDYRVFKTDDELNAFIESIHDLLLANITKELPLKERIKRFAPEYFPYVGAIQDIDVIDLDEETK